ncbi:flagellar basal body-associated FliL family protein [Oryzifoliimicrobium ureilyticus]|uniref:flagellar basal body-associated FliL family protein n=1 Tax=Oryzifoliimicrobium ureilyticus TaxID=3113724 RepID=UPI00307611E9
MAEEEEKKPKKSGMVMTIVGVAILTVIGAGAGWFLGGMMAPKVKTAEEAVAKAEEKSSEGKKEEGKGDQSGIPHISTQESNVVQLEPITANLSYPSENWVRLEVALLFTSPPDVKLAEDIHQDIMAYIRTVTLQQIQGPRGFQYLKDDIQERVDLRAQGRVSKVMFRTFVVE